MKGKSFFTLLFSIGLITLFVSCNSSNSNLQVSKQEQTGVQDISKLVTKMPVAPGSKAFSMYCQICHSARYILDQPKLPPKTWEAIVTKMQKTFGAPVPDSSINEIVGYIVSVKDIQTN